MSTSLRKPRPYDERKKSRIDTRGFVLPKKHPLRSAGYRTHVRRGRCVLLGEGYGDCPTRKCDCAHVEKGGIGIKSTDALTAPLCTGPNGHHRRYDERRLPKAARAIVRRKAIEIRAEWEKRQAERETKR